MANAYVLRRRRLCNGFTYLALLFFVALIGLAAAATVQIGAIIQRRQAEDQLLFVGLAMRAAIKGYYEGTPVGTPSSAPRRLEDLLKDPRYPNPKRYLRQIYIDPLTGSKDWGLIRSADCGLLGVYSKSTDKPIKIANFPDDFFYFVGKKSYADWVFVYGVVCTDNGCELPPDQCKDSDDKNKASSSPVQSKP